MNVNNKIFIFTFLFLLFFSTTKIFSQNSDSTKIQRNEALNIFIDCVDCSMDFIKDEISFVNYVRDQNDAQLYIMITSQVTGCGGNEFTLNFIGRKNFSNHIDTLKFFTAPNDSEDEIRKIGVKYLKMGLMSFVAKTPLAKEIEISYEKSEIANEVEDKWKSWVFTLYGTGSFNLQESQSTQYMYLNIEANKITEDLKIELSASKNIYGTNYFLDDSTTINGITKSNNFSSMIVWSMNQHWSSGFITNTNTSLYSNYKLKYAIFPAIEYNVFKYSESTRRQMCFFYDVGIGRSNYIDTTTFGKLQETLYSHSIGITFKEKETWGSISTSINGTQYLHDFSKFNISLNSSLEIKIFKGLSFNLSIYAEQDNAQINIRKRDATLEEILTQKIQLPSEYYYAANIGLTFTFGSIYNNVVNPRFNQN